MKIARVESGIRKEATEADIHEKCRKIRAVFFHEEEQKPVPHCLPTNCEVQVTVYPANTNSMFCLLERFGFNDKRYQADISFHIFFEVLKFRVKILIHDDKSFGTSKVPSSLLGYVRHQLH